MAWVYGQRYPTRKLQEGISSELLCWKKHKTNNCLLWKYLGRCVRVDLRLLQPSVLASLVHPHHPITHRVPLPQINPLLSMPWGLRVTGIAYFFEIWPKRRAMAEAKPPATPLPNPAAPIEPLRLDQALLSKTSVQGFVDLLRKHLKSNFPQYWKWLKQFCQGKMSKQELDQNLKKILPTKEYRA